MRAGLRRGPPNVGGAAPRGPLYQAYKNEPYPEPTRLAPNVLFVRQSNTKYTVPCGANTMFICRRKFGEIVYTSVTGSANKLDVIL